MSTNSISAAPLRVAAVAGEASGDLLGADLIAALKAQAPNSEFFGIAGPRMAAAGCEAWHRTDELSVMGLAEVLPHLRRILRLRRRLIERLVAVRPDVYIGIDSSDFNLAVEAALKRAGLKTVQYVSPQVWAWRQSRVKKIAAATDLVLCLLPFEKAFYAEHGVNARFVGHPMADAIPLEVDRSAARQALGLPERVPLLAILPGSRPAEVSRLSGPFLATAQWLSRRRPEMRFVVALANEQVGEIHRRIGAGVALDPPARLITGRAREAMAAADAVLTASGTASLEALLLKRPMVVAHRLSPLTYALVRSLGVKRLPHFSLPNLLAGRTLVEEFIQSDVRADILGPAVLRCFAAAPDGCDRLAEFDKIHRALRQGASATAAAAVLELLQRD